MVEKWFVYFITCGQKGSKFVKVGIAKDPSKRIEALQTGNPLTLKLDLSIECRSRKHAMHLESWLHKNFSSYHVRGEWFRYSKLDIPRALAGFQTNVELTVERGKNIHGSKMETKINSLKGRNIALEKTLRKVTDKIDEELDKITMPHLDKFL